MPAHLVSEEQILNNLLNKVFSLDLNILLCIGLHQSFVTACSVGVFNGRSQVPGLRELRFAESE
jgi:hypothetical protein